MKRILFFCAAMLATFACNAQSILILKDGEVIYECSDTRGVEVVFKDPYNGHEYVDLGLPSGLKWATCNVGATKPEEYGDYFAWGEIEPKLTYNWNTYKYMEDGYSSQEHVTKYTTEDNQKSGCWYDGNTYVGTMVDGVTYKNKTVLDPEDDAAHVNWGGDWRMPTREEQEELRTKCSWEWTSQGGVNGCVVTGPNGNSIFLPAAGMRISSLDSDGSYGYYWSSSLIERYSYNAYYLSFYSVDVRWGGRYRYYGFPVRPVCPSHRILQLAPNGQNNI